MRTLGGALLLVAAMAWPSGPALASPQTAWVAAAVPTCFGLTATIVGTDSDDTLVGTPGDDVIVALDGNDTITGLDGDDTICAGPNTAIPGTGGEDDPFVVFDRVDAGAGDDTVDGGDGVDQIYGAEGDDLLTGGTGPDLVRGGPGDDSVFGDDGDDEVDGNGGTNDVHGGPGDDWLQSNDYPDGSTNELFGDAGNDLLDGGRGVDHLDGGVGNDYLRAEGGADVLLGSDGDDNLEGGPGNDVISGGDGINRISFTNDTRGATVDLAIGVASGQGTDRFTAIQGVESTIGQDTFLGSSGPDFFVVKETDSRRGNHRKDVFDGRGGRDTVQLYRYADTFLIDLTKDILVFGDQRTVVTKIQNAEILDIQACCGVGTLIGSSAPNVLIGSAGRDRIRGKGGADELYGGRGDDDLDGGDGSDRIAGGRGHDVCRSPAHEPHATGCDA